MKLQRTATTMPTEIYPHVVQITQMTPNQVTNLSKDRTGLKGHGMTTVTLLGCMKLNCVWLKPELVAQVEFTEWTPDGHLRHSRFVGLRDDKAAGGVLRET
jgi:ATP-dependent DNA ligase